MATADAERRVLVLAPLGRDGRMAREVLAQNGVHAEVCPDMVALCAAIDGGAGALLLTEEALVPGALGQLAERLARQPRWSDLPIVVLTLGTDSGNAGIRALQALHPAANATLLERPVRLMSLVTAIQAALRSRQRQYEMRDHLRERERAGAMLANLNRTLEERVLERTRRLQEINQQLESFSYSVSHNLRTPLRAMHGYAEALLNDFGNVLNGTGQDYAERLIGACRRMDGIIRDLLEYSRLSRTDVPLGAVALEQVAREVVAMQQEEVARSGGRIELRIDPGHRVQAHPAVLGQALGNLVGNALKFVPPGRTPDVRLISQQRDDHVRLWVIDNGIGIAPEHQGLIFGVFERLHHDDRYPGTGVGLAMVRMATERMGGTVGVESEAGCGSRFWIELPAARTVPEPGRAIAETGEVSRRPPSPPEDGGVREDLSPGLVLEVTAGSGAVTPRGRAAAS